MSTEDGAGPWQEAWDWEEDLWDEEYEEWDEYITVKESQSESI